MSFLPGYDKPPITQIRWSDNPTTFDEMAGNFALIAYAILIERQAKYGPDNILKGGILGLDTRIVDKMERNKQSINGTIRNGMITLDPIDTLPDEKAYDGEFDAANYNLIRAMLRSGWWEKRLPLKLTANDLATNYEGKGSYEQFLQSLDHHDAPRFTGTCDQPTLDGPCFKLPYHFGEHIGKNRL